MPTDDPRRWPVKRAFSAGGVVVRDGPAGPEVALVRPRTERAEPVWALPKGIVEAGESPLDAALREVREETGLDAEVVAPLDDVTYWFTWAPERARIRKTVHLFLMRAVGGDPSAHDEEVDEVRFFPLSDAAGRATYTSERAAIRAAAEIVSRPAS